MDPGFLSATTSLQCKTNGSDFLSARQFNPILAHIRTQCGYDK